MKSKKMNIVNCKEVKLWKLLLFIRGILYIWYNMSICLEWKWYLYSKGCFFYIFHPDDFAPCDLLLKGRVLPCHTLCKCMILPAWVFHLFGRHLGSLCSGSFLDCKTSGVWFICGMYFCVDSRHFSKKKFCCRYHMEYIFLPDDFAQCDFL